MKKKSALDTMYLIYEGELHVGMDIRWAFAQCHGHDRHQWFMDTAELGNRVAETLHQENVWMKDRAVSMVSFYDTNQKITLYLSSPEGQEEMAIARAKVELSGTQGS